MLNHRHWVGRWGSLNFGFATSGQRKFSGVEKWLHSGLANFHLQKKDLTLSLVTVSTSLTLSVSMNWSHCFFLFWVDVFLHSSTGVHTDNSRLQAVAFRINLCEQECTKSDLRDESTKAQFLFVFFFATREKVSSNRRTFYGASIQWSHLGAAP